MENTNKGFSYRGYKIENTPQEEPVITTGVDYIKQSELDTPIKNQEHLEFRERPIVNMSNIGRTRKDVMQDIYGDKLQGVLALAKAETGKDEQEFNNILNQTITADMVNRNAIEFRKTQNEITYRDLAKQRNQNELKDLQNMEPIGVLESLKRNASDLIPIVRHGVAFQENKIVRDSIAKMNRGEELSDLEQNAFENYYKMYREEQARGLTTKAKLTLGVAQSLVFRAENALTKATWSGASIPKVFNYYMQEELKNTGLQITPEGEIFFKNNYNNDKFNWVSLALAMGGATLEYGIEYYGGGLIKKGGAFVGGAIAGAVAGNLLTDEGNDANKGKNTLIGAGAGAVAGLVGSKAINKGRAVLGEFFGPKMKNTLNTTSINKFGKSFTTMTKQIGYNGVLGELGEEWLEKPINDLFRRSVKSVWGEDLDPEKLSFDSVFRSLGGFENLEELLLTAGVITIQGGIFGGVNVMANAFYKAGMPKELTKNILTNPTKDKVDYFYKELMNKQLDLADKYKKSEFLKFKKQAVESGRSGVEVDNVINLTNQIIKNIAMQSDKSAGYVLQRMGGMPGVANEEFSIKNFELKGEDVAVNEFYQKNPDIENKINNIIEVANKDKSNNISDSIGDIKEWEIDFLNKNGINVNNETQHIISSSFIRHINKRHSNNNESDLKQRDITEQDIKNIPIIINEPNSVEITENNSIKYTKSFSNGTTYYIEFFKDQNNTLVSKTMWIKKNGMAGNNARNHSNKIITNPNKIVKQNNNTIKARGQYNTINNVITLFENSNKSTLIHEMGHFFLTSLEKTSRDSAISKMYVNEFNELYNDLNVNETDSTTRQEFFAENFESYLRNGKAPSPELSSMFEGFKSLLKDVYKTFRDIGKNVVLNKKGLTNEKVVSYFDKFIITKTPKGGYGGGFDDWKKKNENKIKPIENEKEFSLGFVMRSDGSVYIFKHKISKIHHSSFSDSEDIVAAGIINIKNGKISSISNKSGHFFPSISSVYKLATALNGVKLCDDFKIGDSFFMNTSSEKKIIVRDEFCRII